MYQIQRLTALTSVKINIGDGADIFRKKNVYSIEGPKMTIDFEMYNHKIDLSKMDDGE